MLAYQMIYTGCGKDRTGAYSVWAKSGSVTKSECDEIVKLMTYRKAPNTPYEPTEDEIKALFPPKYCYFVLSSGRKCVAKSTFVGKVYSDLDNRLGNFVIHAYVFDDLGNLNPFELISRDFFKTHLTYKEWHDDPAPTDLPAVEIASQHIASEQLALRWLVGERKQCVLSLLQAVLDSVNSDATVVINDTEENQAQIYALIGMLLPSRLFGALTFCNQYQPQMDYTLTSVGVAPMKLRNVFIGSPFNFQEEKDAGQYVFNFEKRICSEVAPKRYLTDIAYTLESGKGLFAALKKIEAINDIMGKTGCDADTAMAVYYLMQGNLGWFGGSEEDAKAFNVALQHHFVDLKELLKTPLKDETTLSFMFRTICSLPSEQDKIILLGELISYNMQMPQFVEHYVRCEAQNPSIFARAESLNASVKGVGEFLMQKDAYKFKNNPNVTVKSLDEYFTKIYKNGKDDGVYFDKVKQYVSAQQSATRIGECIKIYLQVGELKDGFADVLEIVEYLFGAIFNLSFEELLKYAPQHFNTIAEIHDRLIVNHRRVSERFYLLHTVLVAREMLGSTEVRRAIEGNSLYYQLRETNLAAFVDNYFDVALHLYLSCKSKKLYPRELLLTVIFERPLTELDDIDGVERALKALDANNFYSIMADIMGYAFNNTTQYAVLLQKFVQCYVDTLNRNDYKKLFAKMEDLVEKGELPNVKQFTDKYLADHMNFFEKLFGKRK